MSSKLHIFVDSLSRKDILRAVRISIFGGLVAIVGVFTVVKTHDLLFGTPLEILSPEDGAQLSDSHLRIVGRAPNASTIYIDDGKILPDETGNFVQEYILAPGLNIFEVRAEDRFGRERTQTLSLIYKEVATEQNDNNTIQ